MANAPKPVMTTGHNASNALHITNHQRAAVSANNRRRSAENQAKRPTAPRGR